MLLPVHDTSPKSRDARTRTYEALAVFTQPDAVQGVAILLCHRPPKPRSGIVSYQGATRSEAMALLAVTLAAVLTPALALDNGMGQYPARSWCETCPFLPPPGGGLAPSRALARLIFLISGPLKSSSAP